MLIILALAAWAAMQPPPREPSDAWFRQRLPVTIEVLRDVRVRTFAAKVPRKRGELVLAGKSRAFTILKGQTFQMIEMRDEGECRIRFDSEEYELTSCPWREGFTDRESDIYRPAGSR